MLFTNAPTEHRLSEGQDDEREEIDGENEEHRSPNNEILFECELYAFFVKNRHKHHSVVSVSDKKIITLMPFALPVK